MRPLFTAIALTFAAAAPLTSALADGPRASSELNWRGMTAPVAPSQYVEPAPAAAVTAPPAAHYVLSGHYVGGGKWRQEWVPAQ
jgi:hypothetical protein